MRNGELVGEYEIKDMPQVELVSAMLGKAIDDISRLREERGKYSGKVEIVYEAEGLSSIEGVKPFDFAINKGFV